MLAPSPTNPDYGFLWWLNRRHSFYKTAPAGSVFALGAGGNIIFVDRAHDLVVVMRWMDSAAVDRFLGLVIGATG